MVDGTSLVAMIRVSVSEAFWLMVGAKTAFSITGLTRGRLGRLATAGMSSVAVLFLVDSLVLAPFRLLGGTGEVFSRAGLTRGVLG